MAIELEAPAKINLTLEVLGRREDGFHEIRSVVQRISLADTLTLAPARDLSLSCNRAELNGTDNLVWKAATLLKGEFGGELGAEMTLKKRIPVAAGLGGGSSDAAAALRGLNQLWNVGLAQDRLLELAARLGSDVPFFLLNGPCALLAGRGEQLTLLPRLPLRWLVLVKPDAGISAGAVYRAFPKASWSSGRRTADWLAQSAREGSVPPPFNDLEPVALGLVPAAEGARRALLNAGAEKVVMSGSGSTYFALFESESTASRMLERVREAGEHEAFLATFVTL